MKRIKKNFVDVFLLYSSSLVGSGSTFLIYTILARSLGVKDFGIFGATFSLLTIFKIIAEFGLSQLLLKKFGIYGWNGISWVRPIFKSLLYTTSISFVFVISWSYFGPHEDLEKKIMLIMSVYILGQVVVEFVSSVFQVEERYSFLAIWQLSSNLLRLILFVFMVFFLKINITLSDTAYIYFYVGILFSVVGWVKIYLKDIKLSGHGKRPKKLEEKKILVKNVFKEVWPFGFASIFAFIYLQSDIVMVKYISGDIEAGYYNVSFVIMTALMLFPSVLYQKYFLPKYHRWANLDRKMFFHAYKTGNLAMLLSGIFFMLTIFIFSGIIVEYFFGIKFMNSVGMVKVLSLSIPLYFVSYSVGAVLVTKEHMKTKVKLMGVTAVVNILLNLYLIRYYGAYGAAISTVFCNLLLMLLYLFFAQRYVFPAERSCRVFEN